MVTGTRTTTLTQSMSNNNRSRKILEDLKLETDELSSSRASQASKERWKIDLGSLLKNAQKRFADIAWAVEPGRSEEIWAHKAIIYARASGQFQLKYLSAPAPPPHSRLSIIQTGSSNSFLAYPNSFRSNTPQSSVAHSRRPPSPGGISLASSFAGSVRQVAFLNGTDPTLFQSILEALYTANGLSEVFAFLFDDHAAGDNADARTVKLQKDLLYMWRSKLYADCRIVLVTQPDLDTQAERGASEEEAVFSAHRSILCSRSPYFASLLLDPYSDSNNRVFTLASPPFTPASLHFSLGYLYCGTLEFSNRNFDLATAMQIWRSAQYLGLDLLREEVETKISDMCHSFKDMCKQCVSRIGRVYAFSLALDVNSKRLEKAAESFVVNHFGNIWNKAIGELHYEAQTHLVDLACLSVDPNTVISAIRNSKKLKERLANERSDWSDHLLAMLEPVDEQIGVILQTKFPAVVTSKGFLDLLVGVGFSNDVLERALIMLVAKLTEDTAAETYQVLVGQVLLREDGLPMDARVIVEDAKAGVLKFLKSHWTSVRALNGFDPLENWALKEIADEIEVPVDDLLLASSAATPPALLTRTGLKTKTPTPKSVVKEETRSVSVASLRASVQNRSVSRQQQSSVLGQKRVVVKASPNTPVTPTARTRPPSQAQNEALPSASSSSSTILTRQKQLNATRSKPVTAASTVPKAQPTPRRLSESTTRSLKSPVPGDRRSSASRASSHSIRSPTSPLAASSIHASSSSANPPPLPPIPGSDSSRQNRPSRASRPSTPSVNNAEVKPPTNKSAPDTSRTRKTSEAISTRSKPPRVRTTTASTSASTMSVRSSAASTASVRSNASTAASSTRRVTTSRPPPPVRKTPSSLSMRSDVSNATIGARSRTKRPVKVSTNSEAPSVNNSSVAATRKKVAAVTAALTTPKRPDRLRTTSATARTSAAASVRPAIPPKAPTRPSSVTSVRTTVSASAKAVANSSKNVATGSQSRDSSPNGSTRGRNLKTKPRARQSVEAPPLPVNKSATSKSSEKKPAEVGSTKVLEETGSTKDESSPSSEPSEVIADQPQSAVPEPSGMYTHKSKGSTASVSTIKMNSAGDQPSFSSTTPVLGGQVQPPRTIIVPPSSSSSYQKLSLERINTGRPSKPPGTTLLIGIPCVVATTTTLNDGLVQPIKFRAVVKYLGETYFGPGQWVGVEVAEKEDMPKKDWNEGVVDGIRYFELGQESKESKLRLFRNLSATPSGGERSQSSQSNHNFNQNGVVGNGSSSNHSEEGSSLNSLRPSFNSLSHRNHSFENEEKVTRGLFVRPQEVIFVF